MAPRLSHKELQEWYAAFKQEVYEKANIDMDRIEDIGRIKNFYSTSWDIGKPMVPEGGLSLACVPHEGLAYDNPPPSFEDPEKYGAWLKANLKVPKSDDEIHKLYDMSRAGTLLIYPPGAGENGMRQIYTYDSGRVAASPPINKMVRKGEETPDTPLDHIFPEEPISAPPEPSPADYGLKGFPKKPENMNPERPKNMKPSIFSRIAYTLFGVDNDYAKLKRYEDAVHYEERFKAWYNGLDGSNEKVAEFKEAYQKREAWDLQVEGFLASPIGKFAAISNGLEQYRAGYMMNQESDDIPKEERIQASHLHPTREVLDKEIQVLKEMHDRTPQGEINKTLETVKKQLGYGDRTKQVVRHLVGNDPATIALADWVERGVIDLEKYKPKPYDLPKMPNRREKTPEEKAAYDKKWGDLAEMAGFSALAQTNITGKEPKEGFTAEETAQLNYSNILKSLFTTGTKEGVQYTDYLDPARTAAKEAIDNYAAGKVEPLAELLRNGIRMTNREAANLSDLNSEHAMNTLYLINRMWNTVQKNEALMDAIGLTQEEIQETKANVALYSTMTKGLEAKQALLEHSLYQRDMTPEELQQAGKDVLFAYQTADAVRSSHQKQTEVMGKSADRQAESAERNALADLKRPAHEVGKQLLNEANVNQKMQELDAKYNLNSIKTMKREALGDLVKSQIGFRNAFSLQPQQPKKPEPAMTKEMTMIKEKVAAMPLVPGGF